MCATMSSNKIDDNRKGATDDEGVTIAGKNAKNKEEGAEVFSEVGKVIHFYEGQRL